MTSNEVHQYDPKTRKYLKSFPSKSDAERELGLYRGSVADSMRSKNPKVLFSLVKAESFPGPSPYPNTVVETTEKPSEPQRAVLLTEQQLRQKHDMFYQLMFYVNTIPEGKFIEEGMMLRQLGISGKPRYKDVVSRPELKNFKGKVDGTVYYGSESSIKKLKTEGVLQ